LPKVSLRQAETFLIDILSDVLGGALFAVGLSCFTSPNQIAPGGVSGLLVIINYIFGLPLGIGTFLFNLPLIAMAWIFLGRSFTLKTAKSTAILSLMIELAESFFPKYTGDALLAALFGGIFMGAGLAAVFRRGSTTGGSDIVSRLIQRKYPHTPIGKLILYVDVAVVALSMIVFKNIESGLYGAVSIFTCSRVLDSILAGVHTGRMILIISEREKEIAGAIIDRLERGVTVLNGYGAYTGKERKVLMCSVRAPEHPKVMEVIKKIDPNAFIIICDAREILGEGFHSVKEDKFT